MSSRRNGGVAQNYEQVPSFFVSCHSTRVAQNDSKHDSLIWSPCCSSAATLLRLPLQQGLNNFSS